MKYVLRAEVSFESIRSLQSFAHSNIWAAAVKADGTKKTLETMDVRVPDGSVISIKALDLAQCGIVAQTLLDAAYQKK